MQAAFTDLPTSTVTASHEMYRTMIVPQTGVASMHTLLVLHRSGMNPLAGRRHRAPKILSTFSKRHFLLHRSFLDVQKMYIDTRSTIEGKDKVKRITYGI